MHLTCLKGRWPAAGAELSPSGHRGALLWEGSSGWQCNEDAPSTPFACGPSRSCTATAKSFGVICLHCSKGFHGEEGRKVRGNEDSFKCVFLLQRNSESKFTLRDQGLCNGWVLGRPLVNVSANLNSAGGSHQSCPHFPICDGHFKYSSTQIKTPYKHANGAASFFYGYSPCDWLSEHAQLGIKLALLFSYKPHPLPRVLTALLAPAFLTPWLQRSCSQRRLLLNNKRLTITIS